MRRQLKYKSQGKKSVPKDGREEYTRPTLRQIKKGPAERRAYQAQGMSHPGQKKESTESLRSKFRQLVLKKRQVPSESHFKEGIKLLLQWIFPSKGGEPEEPLQKGRPETATVQRQESIKSKSTADSRAVEAQTVVTAVGLILKERMVFHQGPQATELNWCQAELQGPRGPHYCHHRSCVTKRKGGRGETHPVITKPPRRATAFQKRVSGPVPGTAVGLLTRGARSPPGRARQHGSQVTRAPGHSPHCPRHGLPQKRTSPGEFEHAFHGIPGGKTLLQEKNACHVSTSSVC